ncbi:MAG: hypothetical protein K6U12_09025 [Armatimonadetes bacterium]|nr:hypothetical protein [Armatimonadota bacterium]
MQENWKDVIIRIGRVLQEFVNPLESQATIAFVRPSRPVAYQVPLSRFGTAEELSKRLLASGLNWCWLSAWGTQQRSPTPPTTETVAELIRDLQEEVDGEGNHRLVFLFAHDSGATERLCAPSVLREALEVFAAGQPEPIRLVLISLPDCAYGYLFVPQAPIEAVRHLLDMWRVAPKREYPYSHLQSAQLETVVSLLMVDNDSRDG